MIEGFCDFLPEALLVEAIEEGLAAVRTIALAIGEWAQTCGRPTYDAGVRTPLEGVDAKVEDIVGSRIEASLCGPSKGQREDWTALCAEAVEILTDPGAETVYEKADVKMAFKRLASETLRQMGARGKRQDGRSTTEVRPIDIVVSPLPQQVHGSCLFTRGETQSLATATLGDQSMAQRYEDLRGDHSRTFYLQYSFPPWSVGEVGRNGAPGRREIGHGNLAERALKTAVPDMSDFPYVVRVESLITESCGSSSMASVCGGWLAMAAAGVPMKKKVAGIAMGLLLDEGGGGGEPIVLTDILGSEDALGTMDFKVAGDGEGVTAFQLDIKCEGLDIPLMRRALEQARVGRLHILDIMEAACPKPSDTLPPSVPRFATTSLEPSKVGMLIGTGGATIKSIIEESGVTNIRVEKDGSVVISSTDDGAIERAMARIDEIASAAPRGGGGGRGGGR